MTDNSNDLSYSYIRLKGVTIRAAVRKGTEPGVPLLLFNGIGASIELLEPFIEAIPETTVIAFDAPGAGESTPPKYPWRPRHHAALAAALLDRLNFEDVNVLGVSWGGGIAQQFARQYPQRCKKLILAATSCGQIMVPGHPSVLIRMSNPLRYLSQDYMVELAPRIYGGSLRDNPRQALGHARLMKPPSIKGYYFQLMAIIGWTSLHWLHKLEQPTLVMAGDDDPIIPLINAKIMAARIPNARLRIVDCGHLFLLTRAKTLAPEILKFLA